MSETDKNVGMSVTVFHCVCRTCPAEAVVTRIADRAEFYRQHEGPGHDPLTRELTVPEREGDSAVAGTFLPSSPGASGGDGGAATPD